MRLGRDLGADGTYYIVARGSRGGTDGCRVGGNRGLVDNFNAILIPFRTNRNAESGLQGPGCSSVLCK